MANLTIVVDDELLKRARVRAIEEGTSVNEVCRQAIERFAGESNELKAQKLREKIREIAAQMKPSPDGEPLWPGREALYEEVMRERGLIKDPPDRSGGKR